MVGIFERLKGKKVLKEPKTQEEIISEKLNELLEFTKTKKGFLARELGRVADSQRIIKSLKKQTSNPAQIRIQLGKVEQNIISSQGEDEAEIDEIDVKEQRLIREIEKLL
ncbi:hypothetical protein HN681_04700 [archaeon]|jgi:hypothetical protein|nr:hypothetical protein [archaeon]MBT3731007.1 hypothetical protein [archaeon]MBT4669755.1 hypothetical protein [archaeon]MBT5029905.1 hypothetical protein [archaeon]MBT5288477.1 hypothetical protein [archaeon]